MIGPIAVWQRLADEVELHVAATVRHVTWWGFYDRDNPPTAETMRMRIYGQRAWEALPDEANIIYEEYFINPAREATGREVLVGIFPAEYQFEADLGAPVTLPAQTPLWLEIVQIGDRQTNFRWEYSLAGVTGHAFINSAIADWQHTMNTPGELAFQLSTIPEPSSILLFSFSSLCAFRRKPRRKEMH